MHTHTAAHTRTRSPSNLNSIKVWSDIYDGCTEPYLIKDTLLSQTPLGDARVSPPLRLPRLPPPLASRGKGGAGWGRAPSNAYRAVECQTVPIKLRQRTRRGGRGGEGGEGGDGGEL